MLTSQTVKTFTDSKNPGRFNIRILKQCKLLSQLLAKSWIEDPEGKGQKIRNIILNKDGNAQDFRDLISGKIPELFKTPIFEGDELETYVFKIDWNTFEGSINEYHQLGSRQTPQLIVNIPYPPRPSEFNLNLDDKKFLEWLNSEVNMDDPSEGVTDPFPPVPYVPLSCT